MKRLVSLAALCGLVISAALPAAAAPADQMFVNQAAMGGMAEVRLAQLALNRTKSPRVRAFASRMIADHTTNNAMLVSIARKGGYALPPDVGADNVMRMHRLAAMHAESFDTAYMRGQVGAHEQMLTVMQREGATGSDPKLVRFAKATVPTVQAHLSMARMDAMPGM